MKKFQFGLDNVLGYRQQVLEGRQNEYARAARMVQEQQEKLDQIRDRYSQLNRQFREQAARGMTAADAMGFEYGLRGLEQQITREDCQLQKLQQEAEEKRSQMLQAHMDAAVLERLKEKKKNAYRKEVQKSDERMIEELVGTVRLMEAQA